MEQGRGYVAILASRPEEVAQMTLELQGRGVTPIPVQTWDQLWASLLDTPSIGVVVGVATLIQLPDLGKDLIRRIDALLPVAKFKADGARGLSVMSPATGLGLDAFLATCVERGPKHFRRNERYKKHLNVIISKDPHFTSPEWSFTFDISEDGCFAYTEHAWDTGDRIWLSIREPFRDFPIEATVMRYVPWGTPFQPQGVGLRFMNPKSAEIVRLIQFVSPARAPRVLVTQPPS